MIPRIYVSAPAALRITGLRQMIFSVGVSHMMRKITSVTYLEKGQSPGTNTLTVVIFAVAIIILIVAQTDTKTLTGSAAVVKSQ